MEKPEGSTSLSIYYCGGGVFAPLFRAARDRNCFNGLRRRAARDFETTLHQVLADRLSDFVVQLGCITARTCALWQQSGEWKLAAQTGGAAYIPKTTLALDSAFQEIAADLAQQYVLSYYPGADPRDGRFHLIELRIKSRKDVRVRARKGYYSPKAANVATRDW